MTKPEDSSKNQAKGSTKKGGADIKSFFGGKSSTKQIDTKEIDDKDQKYAALLERIKKLPISMQLNLRGQYEIDLEKNEKMRNAISKDDKRVNPKDIKSFLYGKVCFRTENYVEDTSLSRAEKYDTIICLSTIKYVHLNFGDIGIKALFLKVYDQLEKGGLFILENQLWKSYKKSKNLSERTKRIFSET